MVRAQIERGIEQGLQGLTGLTAGRSDTTTIVIVMLVLGFAMTGLILWLGHRSWNAYNERKRAEATKAKTITERRTTPAVVCGLTPELVDGLKATFTRQQSVQSIVDGMNTLLQDLQKYALEKTVKQALEESVTLSRTIIENMDRLTIGQETRDSGHQRQIAAFVENAKAMRQLLVRIARHVIRPPDAGA